jgi:hypothetical protein
VAAVNGFVEIFSICALFIPAQFYLGLPTRQRTKMSDSESAIQTNGFFSRRGDFTLSFRAFISARADIRNRQNNNELLVVVLESEALP